MSRTLLTVSIDEGAYRRCREHFHGTDSELLDRALTALAEALESEHELRVLDALPFEDELESYEGPIPAEVMAEGQHRQGPRNEQ